MLSGRFFVCEVSANALQPFTSERNSKLDRSSKGRMSFFRVNAREAPFFMPARKRIAPTPRELAFGPRRVSSARSPSFNLGSRAESARFPRDVS